MPHQFFLPGQIVTVKKAGFIDHEGIVVHENKVIHNSPHHGGVVISKMEDFADTQQVFISDKYAPRATRDQMVVAAYAAAGKRKWWPWYNCQHFISEVAGLRLQSRQLTQVMPVFFVLGLAMLIRSR